MTSEPQQTFTEYQTPMSSSWFHWFIFKLLFVVLGSFELKMGSWTIRVVQNLSIVRRKHNRNPSIMNKKILTDTYLVVFFKEFFTSPYREVEWLNLSAKSTTQGFPRSLKQRWICHKVSRYVNLRYENTVPCLRWKDLETSPAPPGPLPPVREVMIHQACERYISLLLTVAKLKSSDLRRGDSNCRIGLPQHSTHLFFQCVAHSSLRFSAERFLCMARWCLRRLMREMIRPRTLVSGNILQGVYLGGAESEACLIIYFKGDVCVTTKLDMHPVPYCIQIRFFSNSSFPFNFHWLNDRLCVAWGQNKSLLHSYAVLLKQELVSEAIVT